MAGRVVVSTLNDDTGVLATQNGMLGIARAWVNFNGSTSPGTIRAQFNVSSVTKNGTGDYTINFTTAMPNANYVVNGMSKEFDNTNSSTVMCFPARQTIANTYSTTFTRILSTTTGGTFIDGVAVLVVVNGN